MVNSIAAAIWDMILLFEQINIPSGILYITTDLAKRKKIALY